MSVALSYGKKAFRGILIFVVAILALAVLVRAFSALVEALAVFGLVCVLASLVLPQSLGAYWRQMRRRVPEWLRQAAALLEPKQPPETGDAAVKDKTA